MTTVQGIREAVYPAKPESTALRKHYERLRQAAIGISISRGIYFGKLKKAKAELTTLKAAIETYQREEQISKQKIATLLHQMDEMSKIFATIEDAGDELAGEMDRYDHPTTKVDIYRGKPVFAVLNAVRRFRQAWTYAKQTNDIEVIDGQAS